MHRALLTRPLLASASLLAEPCKQAADGSISFGCRLAPYLTALYIIAVLLALVLLGVIAAAIHQYRRNERTDLTGR